MRSSLQALAWVLLPLLLGCGGGGGGGTQAPAVFVVHDPSPSFEAPRIVLQHDPATSTGWDWDTAQARATVSNNKVFQRDDEMLAWGAVAFLREGIAKMTGRTLDVVSGTDVDRGIVLLTLAGAPQSLRADPEIQAGLASHDPEGRDAAEAYVIRTEPERVLIVANQAGGLIDGVVDLLESVDYEVLGMGPDWIHVPDRHDGLSFSLRTAGRPSWWLREPTATSGQYYGVGTVYDTARTPLVDPTDETVGDSYWRWRVGTRTWASSMPGFPGHALQARHADVLAEMVARGSTEGFLAPTRLGLDADRPAATTVASGTLWVDTDAEGTPAHGKVLLSNGATWTAYDPAYLPVSLDLTTPVVREVVLRDLETRADTWFAAHPDTAFVYGTEPEDGGGYASFAARAAHPTWYPDYRQAVGDPLGAPYPLDGLYGLDQPTESYDPTSVADCVYAFDDWLLREYDGWLATRPAAERVTSSGQFKSDLVRLSFYSYNYHDVPPGFVPDPRMRVMVAGYPKHRGLGRWAQLATPTDVASALHVLLPRDPPGIYSIWSYAYGQDFGLGGVTPTRSSAAAALQPVFGDMYAAGVRAFSAETDFNFGKHALSYYLMPQLLWDASLDVEQVDALRDRWLERAFGSGWQPMKAYYDLLTPEAWYANTETLWAQAVAFIEQADALIDPQTEPDEQRRLDDVKEMWWYHYLTVSGRAVDTDPGMQTFAWKGQMSYQVAMHVVLRRIFGQTYLDAALDPQTFEEPAHYSAQETAAWWDVVRAAWHTVPVTHFADVRLADGTPAADVDLNDLVWTDEMVAAGTALGIPHDRTFWFNSGYQKEVSILVSAAQGDPVGFTLGWTEDVERHPTCRIDRWDPVGRAWEALVDTTVAPVPQDFVFPVTPGWLARYEIPAPQAGTYRVEIGRGGNVAQATGVGYDFGTLLYDALRPCTYFQSQDGLTQYEVSPMAFSYIPQGVPSLDLELLNDNGGTVKIYTRGLLHGEPYTSRTVTLGGRGTMVIPLQAGEDGGLAAFTWSGFLFPVLYSVPQLWARSPTALLVPRAVAAADGLTVR